MAGFVETATRSFEAGAAIAQHLRVKLTAGVLATAGLTDKELGTIETASFASGDKRAVRLSTAQGTCKMTADGVVSVDATVYTAASGKISATQGNGSWKIGKALEAATADGDIIEILRDDATNLTAGTGDVVVKCGTVAADKISLQAYDIDAAAYVEAISIQSHATLVNITIGASATDTIGFFGAAGVDQAAHIADASGDDATAVNAILVVLEQLGLVAIS